MEERAFPLAPAIGIGANGEQPGNIHGLGMVKVNDRVGRVCWDQFGRFFLLPTQRDDHGVWGRENIVS